MKKLVQWYDEGILPSLGIVTYNKDVSKCIDMLLDYHLVECKWTASEVACASACWKRLLKISEDDAQAIQAVQSYLLTFLHRFVTLSDIKSMASVFAGWHREFQAGIVFDKWRGTDAVWGVLFVDTVKHSLTAGYYDVDIRVIAGPATGIHVIRRVESRSANMLFRELIGFKGGPLDSAPSVLFLGGLYFIALLQMNDRQVDMTQAYTTSSMKDLNKELMTQRDRPCVGQFFNAVEDKPTCSPYCPLSRTDCILSTHADARHAATCKNLVTRHTGYIMNQGYCSKCLRDGLVNVNLSDDQL